MAALKRLFKPGKKKQTDPNNKSPHKGLEDAEEADDGDWTMISHEESPKKASRDDFEVEAKLGKGAFGMVLKVKKKATGETFAMKVINKKNVLDHGRVKDLFSERSVLRMTKHPFIVQLEAAFQSETKLFFIMEYLPGGDLDGYLRRCEPKRFEENLARVYAAEVYLALRYLHDQKIIYRDLKPENILLDSNGHACLSDFGLSKVFEADNPDTDVDLRADSFVGSPFYVSPDVLRQREYGAAVDWWSFGVLLFRMITGGVPFTGGNIRQVFDSILRNKVDLSPYPWVSTEAQDLISNLLQKDATKRLTGDQVKEHPWFAAVDWDRVYAKRYSMKFNQQQSSESSPSVGTELGRTPPGELNTLQQKYFDGFSYQNSGGNSLRAAASNNSLS